MRLSTDVHVALPAGLLVATCREKPHGLPGAHRIGSRPRHPAARSKAPFTISRMDVRSQQVGTRAPLVARGAVAIDGSDAIVLTEPDGTIASWDRHARAMFGYSSEEVVGLPLCTLFAADRRDAVDGLARAMPSAPLRLVASALDKDGVCFETEITASRTLAVRDGAIGVVEVVRDITESRAVEAALVACAGARDCATAVALVGEALKRWVPYSALTLGRAGAGTAVEVQGTRVVVPLMSAERVFATLRVRLFDGRMVSGRILRVLAAVADAIGPPLWRTRELEEKSRTIGRLKRLDRLEKELLALITHDMRTPLTVISSFASTLRDNWQDLSEGERLAGLEAILRNGESLARFVEQDLELALVGAGELRYEIATFDIAGQIDRIVDDFARTADRQFARRIDRPLALVRADPRRNSQILCNLISNALKFSPPDAPVEICAVSRDQVVHVAVRDHGPGISPTDLPQVFRKFSRLMTPGVRAPHGTGLGLYLCKRMVAAQGGQIWVESREGAGATFTYTLPLATDAI